MKQPYKTDKQYISENLTATIGGQIATIGGGTK